MGIHPTVRRGETMGRGTGGTSVGTFDDRLYLPARLHAWGKQRQQAAPEPSQVGNTEATPEPPQTANKQATPHPSKVINQETTTKRSQAADKQAAPGLSKEANVNSQMITTTREVSRQQSSTGPSRSTREGQGKSSRGELEPHLPGFDEIPPV